MYMKEILNRSWHMFSSICLIHQICRSLVLFILITAKLMSKAWKTRNGIISLKQRKKTKYFSKKKTREIINDRKSDST